MGHQTSGHQQLIITGISLMALAIDPNSSDAVYALAFSVYPQTDPQFFRSRDGGASWTGLSSRRRSVVALHLWPSILKPPRYTWVLVPIRFSVVPMPARPGQVGRP